MIKDKNVFFIRSYKETRGVTRIIMIRVFMGEIAHFFLKIAINRVLNFKNPLLRQNVTNIFVFHL
jgi:hypothetical protein